MKTNNPDEPVFLFAKDLLTGEELLERLAAAQDVVSSLTAKINLADDQIEMQKDTIAYKQGIIDRLVDDMRDMARDLARCAGAAHKEKNEAILGVIYRLLSAYTGRSPARDMDDIPW